MNTVNKILSIVLSMTFVGTLCLAYTLTHIHAQFTVTFGDVEQVQQQTEQITIAQLVEDHAQPKKIVQPKKP